MVNVTLLCRQARELWNRSNHIPRIGATEQFVPNICSALELQSILSQTYVEPWSSRMFRSSHISHQTATECFVPNILNALEIQHVLFQTYVTPASALSRNKHYQIQ
jgi:hypothetical protein